MIRGRRGSKTFICVCLDAGLRVVDVVRHSRLVLILFVGRPHVKYRRLAARLYGIPSVRQHTLHLDTVLLVTAGVQMTDKLQHLYKTAKQGNQDKLQHPLQHRHITRTDPPVCWPASYTVPSL